MRNLLIVLAPLLSSEAVAKDPISGLASKTRWLKPIPTSKWVGGSVLFLEQWRGTRGDYSPGMPREKYLGREAKVLSIADDGNTLVLQMSDDSSVVRMSKVDGRFKDILFLDEFERARKFLLGNSFYTIEQRPMLFAYDSAREVGVGTEIPRFKPWRVTSVTPGTDNDKPLKVVFKNTQGDSGYWHGSLSNTNRDPKHEYDFLMFERCFSQKDPHTMRNWPDSIWSAIAQWNVVKGMTPEQVRLAKAIPLSIDHDKQGCDESWFFFDGSLLCFKRGRLESWESYSLDVAH